MCRLGNVRVNIPVRTNVDYSRCNVNYVYQTPSAVAPLGDYFATVRLPWASLENLLMNSQAIRAKAESTA